MLFGNAMGTGEAPFEISFFRFGIDFQCFWETPKKKMERLSKLSCQMCAAISPVTTHVLDTSTGKPAEGISIRIYKQTNGEWMKLNETKTNADGRTNGLLLEPDSINQGDTYRMVFETNSYFEKCFYPYVEIVFHIEDPTSHYHVPLLISPYAYSTYRGS